LAVGGDSGLIELFMIGNESMIGFKISNTSGVKSNIAGKHPIRIIRAEVAEGLSSIILEYQDVSLFVGRSREK
jgi:hypothetical protein